MVGIIILNYNNWRDTINCIESIEKYNTASVKYIVVDNASTDEDAVKMIAEYLDSRFHEHFKLLEVKESFNEMDIANLVISDENKGYANGNNIGLTLAFADSDINYIMILNNDVLFVEDIIPNLIKQIESLDDAGLISPVLYKKDMISLDYNCGRKDTSLLKELLTNVFMIIPGFVRRFILNRRYYLSNGIPEQSLIPIELPSGSCMLAKKEVFKRIGGFDTNTFLYWEENILYQKLKAIKKRNYLCTNLKCIHLGAASTSKLNFNGKMEAYNLQSELYYFRTYVLSSKILYFLLLLSTKIRRLESKLIALLKHN